VEPRRKKRKRESKGGSESRDREEVETRQNYSRSSNGVAGYSLRRLDPKKFQPGFLDSVEEDPNGVGDVHLKAEDIEEESNRVWILQCPANVNLGKLIGGKKINLGGTTQLELELESSACEAKQYEAVGLINSGETGKPTSMMALLPDESGELKLVAAPINGYIMIRESLEELPVPKLLPNPKPHHTLPEGIKERHPIYGADFTKVFQEIASRSNNKQKKKKKKRRVNGDDDLIDTPQKLSEIETPHKSKKSKLNGSIPASPILIKTESFTPKKKKRTVDHHTDGTNYHGLLNGHRTFSEELKPSFSSSLNSNTGAIPEDGETDIVKKRSKKSKRKLETD